MSKHIQPISHYLPHERMKTFLTQNFATFPTTISRRDVSQAVLKNRYFRPCFSLSLKLASLAGQTLTRGRVWPARLQTSYKSKHCTGVNHVSTC